MIIKEEKKKSFFYGSAIPHSKAQVERFKRDEFCSGDKFEILIKFISIIII